VVLLKRTPNDVMDSIIDAIQYLIDRAISKAGFDITKTGTITKVLGNNQYKVMIDGVERTLFCAVDLNLMVPNIVYVNFAQGNIQNAYISGIKRK
jgi:hypothetical protein